MDGAPGMAMMGRPSHPSLAGSRWRGGRVGGAWLGGGNHGWQVRGVFQGTNTKADEPMDQNVGKWGRGPVRGSQGCVGWCYVLG